jgi:beta-lactamase class A
LLARLFTVVVVALILSACSDVADEQPAPTTTPGPSTAVEPPSPTHAPPTATPELAVTTVTPAPELRPVGTPQGTTGLQRGSTPGITYDEVCLDGDPEVQALPPAETVSVTPIEGNEFPGPFEPIAFAQDEALKLLLDEAVGGGGAAYAYYVKDLSTGRGAGHNGDGVFNAASLFKLFVMYEVFRQERLGLIDWGDELVVTPYYDAFALSPRVTELCQVITVGEAMDAMLSVSDNAAAVLLQDLVGSSNVNASISALGLQDSGLHVEGLPVTANDLALLMEAIATGNAIGPEASADMLALLDHDVFENGLVGGVPAGTVVARKTGNWADATHVAGVVYAPWGPYMFVALTSNGYETEVIRALSSATWGYFEGMSRQSGQ